MTNTGLAGGTGEICTASPHTLAATAAIAFVTAHSVAGIADTVPLNAGLTIIAYDATAGIVDTDPVNAALEERAAHLSAAWDTLTLSAVLTRATVDRCAWVRDTLDAVAANRTIRAAGLSASILHTFSKPAAILFLVTGDPLARINAHQ